MSIPLHGLSPSPSFAWRNNPTSHATHTSWARNVGLRCANPTYGLHRREPRTKRSSSRCASSVRSSDVSWSGSVRVEPLCMVQVSAHPMSAPATRGVALGRFVRGTTSTRTERWTSSLQRPLRPRRTHTPGRAQALGFGQPLAGADLDVPEPEEADCHGVDAQRPRVPGDGAACRAFALSKERTARPVAGALVTPRAHRAGRGQARLRA